MAKKVGDIAGNTVWGYCRAAIGMLLDSRHRTVTVSRLDKVEVGTRLSLVIVGSANEGIMLLSRWKYNVYVMELLHGRR